MSDDENYQVGATGKLYIVKSLTGGKPFVNELHSGHHYQGINKPDTSNHDLTFVKFLCLEAENKRRLDRFARQETSHSADAAFEHVVRYIDYVPNMHALVTERLDWEGIDPRNAHFSDEATLDIAWDMIQALVYIHGRGIIHGDVRPENILPLLEALPGAVHRAKQRYKLIGHGLVPRVMGERSAPGLRYTAPELRSQAQYKPTFRSDIWMLGMVLLECHTHGPAPSLPRPGQQGGLVPARTISRRAAAGKTIARLDPRLRGCSGPSHRLLSDLLQRMLDTNPWRRWTAEELLDGMAHARWLGEERAAAQREVQVVKEKVLCARKEVWKATVVRKVFRGVRMAFERVFVLLVL